MNKKRLGAAALAGALWCGLAGCGTRGSMPAQSDAVEQDTAEIAYIVKANSDDFWTSMEQAAKAYAKEKGIVLSYQAPKLETDVEMQIQYVESAVARQVDAIVLSPADSKSLAPAIAKANKADIPVVLVNDEMDAKAMQEAGAQVETYVGIDQYEAARLAGEYAAETVGAGQVCYLEGIAGVQAHQERLRGFQEACADWISVASMSAECNRQKAYEAMQSVLAAHPEVDIVWAINSEMGQGALEAIEEGGFTGISVFDFDATDEDLEAVANRTLAGTVAQNPGKQARTALQACLNILEGEEVPEHMQIEAELITPET